MSSRPSELLGSPANVVRYDPPAQRTGRRSARLAQRGFGAPSEVVGPLSQFCSEDILFATGTQKEGAPVTQRSAAISCWLDFDVALMFGRALALCVHPVAAWRLLSMPGRSLMLVTYVVGGYVIGGLLLLTFA